MNKNLTHNSREYERIREKLNIAMSSKMYDADELRRQIVIKYYRQCLYNSLHNKPLPAYPQ